MKYCKLYISLNKYIVVVVVSMKQTYQLRNRKWDRAGFAMLMSPNKDELAVHGCHCPCDVAGSMRKIIATYIYIHTAELVRVLQCCNWRCFIKHNKSRSECVGGNDALSAYERYPWVSLLIYRYDFK